jgi:Chromo (CHRromatin Organisation MOdifier) domain
VATYNALFRADQEPEIKTILLSFPSVEINEQQLWRFAGLTVETILQFERDTNEKRRLQRITFNCTSLLHVDVLTNVVNKALQVMEQEESNEPLDLEMLEAGGTDSTPTAEANNGEVKQSDEWHAVKRVLRQRKRKGRMQYLVEWENSDDQTWVDRKNISDFAVQAYLASRKRKRRRAQ